MVPTVAFEVSALPSRSSPRWAFMMMAFLSLSQGDSVDLASTFCLNNLLPSKANLSKYYRYQGSLTTPDCAEVVVWTLFEEPIPISQSQVKVRHSSLVNPAEGLQYAEFLPTPSSWSAVQGAEILLRLSPLTISAH